jgi:protein-tyrosine phosphatase
MRILFVCLGNICRSPSAEALLRQRLQLAGLAERITVDSAGIAAWHIGQAPDPRTREAASRRGYDLTRLRARQVTQADFSRFDLLLAMDAANLRDLNRLRPAHATAELDLYLRRCHLPVHEVPDPYHGGVEGFERVLDLLEQASDALLAELKGRL